MVAKHWRVWGLAAGGIVLAGILLVWARSQHAHTEPRVSGLPLANEGKALPTRQEFEASVVGLTGAEVRRKLGDPEKVATPQFVSVPGDPAEGGWRYLKATRNADTGQPDEAAWLWMRHGRVSHVTFSP